jgi:cytochrome b561
MKQISRYHPLLVALHWVLAVLIVAELSLGFFGLAATPSSEPGKIGILRVHMMGGVLILALMVLRFIVRMRTSRPPAATTGYPLLDRIAPISHYGFYVLVLMMVGSGFATTIAAGLGEIVFGSSGAPLPPTLMTYPPCRPRLLCDAACRLRRLARACRVLPPVRQKRRVVPADVFRATSGRTLGCGGIILPNRCPVRG